MVNFLAGNMDDCNKDGGLVLVMSNKREFAREKTVQKS